VSADGMDASREWARAISAETDEDRADASRDDLEADMGRAAEWAVPALLARIAMLEGARPGLTITTPDGETTTLHADPGRCLWQARALSTVASGLRLLIPGAAEHAWTWERPVPVAHPPPEPDLEPAIGDEPA